MKNPITQKGPFFDIHVHFLDEPKLDAELLDFARRWQMPFGASCLGFGGNMITNPTFDECRRCNDLVLELMQAYPDLAYGFCYVSQKHGERAVDEIRRCVGDHGMAGIKLWVAVKCNDERTFPIVEEAISLDVPILQHSYLRWEEFLPGESKPKEIAWLARKYPEMKMIMAHMALRWREGIDTVKGCPNIFVDTGGFDPEMGSIEYAVKELGAERVLFGSDAPGRDILCQLGKVMAADISETERDKILRSNARKLLRLTGGAA